MKWVPKNFIFQLDVNIRISSNEVDWTLFQNIDFFDNVSNLVIHQDYQVQNRSKKLCFSSGCIYSNLDKYNRLDDVSKYRFFFLDNISDRVIRQDQQVQNGSKKIFVFQVTVNIRILINAID